MLQRLCCLHYQNGTLQHPLGTDRFFPVLQYADDTLIIFKGDLEQAMIIKDILASFSAFSGLTINFHKRMLVPISVDASVASEIAHLLGCPISSTACTYLGLPLSLNKITHGMLTNYSKS